MLTDDEGYPAGAFAFTNVSPTNVELTMCISGAMTARVARFVLRQAFDVLKVNRISAHTRASNARAQRAMERMGFAREGVARGFYGDEDAVSYGMIKHEQRLI